jgi:hypothetical protein
MRRSHVLPPGLVIGTVAATSRSVVGRAARASLALYVVALAGTVAARASRARPLDLVRLPLVLVTMHVSWGLGFLVGSARFGPPVAAVVALWRRGES